MTSRYGPNFPFPLGIDVKRDFGAVGDGTADDTVSIQNAINNAVSSGTDLYLPVGNYRVTSGLTVNGALNIKGAGGKITADGYFALLTVKADGFKISNVQLVCKTKDHSKTAAVALYLGNKVSSSFNYIKDIVISGCTIRNFTTSIKAESVYWMKIQETHTYNDYQGFTSNLETNATDTQINPSTTIALDRVYFHGADAGTISTGSTGISIKNAVNITFNSCVSEWYDSLGWINAAQTVTMTDMYLERANLGFEFIGVTGSTVIVNPYTNLVSAWTFRISYGTYTFVGCRGTLPDGAYFIDKLWESSLIQIGSFAIDGGGGLLTDTLTGAAWDKSRVYQFGNGVTLNDSNAAVRLLDSTNKGIVLSPTTIGHTDPNGPILFNVGGTNHVSVSGSGAQIKFLYSLNSPYPTDPQYENTLLVVKADKTGTHDGVSDSVYMCLRDATNTLQWVQLYPSLGASSGPLSGSSLPTPNASYKWQDFVVVGVTGVAQVSTLTVTDKCSTAGNVSVILDGVTFPVALATTDNTTALVATKIRSATYTGWTTGGSGSTVTFTKITKGSVGTMSYSAGPTGATGTLANTTTGVTGTSDAV